MGAGVFVLLRTGQQGCRVKDPGTLSVAAAVGWPLQGPEEGLRCVPPSALVQNSTTTTVNLGKELWEGCEEWGPSGSRGCWWEGCDNWKPLGPRQGTQPTCLCPVLPPKVPMLGWEIPHVDKRGRQAPMENVVGTQGPEPAEPRGQHSVL